MTPIVEVISVHKAYPVRGSRDRVLAVDGVSFAVAEGETLGIVGESGCGKSTLARLISRHEIPTAGRIVVEGRDITALRGRELFEARQRMQLVFQDPYGALNPRMSVRETLLEVLKIHRPAERHAQRLRRAHELLNMVGLPATFIDAFPHQMSGGQRQRVGILRALAVEPRVLVLDEPVSALDVSVQAEVVNLLVRLRQELNLTYIFISHDLGVVRHISDRIAVMYLGKVVELGPWDRVSDNPLHPYSRALRAAVPEPDPAVEATRVIATVPGEVSDPAHPPSGCSFHPRCPLAEAVCVDQEPELLELSERHLAACHVAAREAREAVVADPPPLQRAGEVSSHWN